MSLCQRFLILSMSRIIHKKQCMYTIYNNFCNILCKILLSKVNYEIKESLLNEKSNEDRNIGILF